MKRIGIDIGGMSVKGLLTDETGTVFSEATEQIPPFVGGEILVDACEKVVEELLIIAGETKENVLGVGVGCPGMIDGANGVVVFSGNLALKDFPLGGNLSAKVNLPVKIINDGNAAALGEAKFGAGKEYSDSILITLGTGVGGGIVVGGKLFEGFSSAGAEIGHMVIVEGGAPCTCGRKGCLEAYASATALMNDTKAAMKANPNSKMWLTYTEESVTGKTAFDYADEDDSAKGVLERYLKHLACGITNLANVFRPQVVLLGGGVSAQGEKLVTPLKKMLDDEVFGGQGYAPVDLKTAFLKNKAGVFGAAALWD